MDLHFGKQRRNQRQSIQFILAFGLLALAIAVTVAWILIGFHQSTPPQTEPSDVESSQYEEPLTTVSRCLLILDTAESHRFLLLQSDPANNHIYIADIPHQLADAGGNSLDTLLQKHGPLYAMQAASTVFEFPIEHYIALSSDGLSAFLSELDNGVTYTLPESVEYIDENGAAVRLSVGEHKLTGSQTAAVLLYNGWSSKETEQAVTTQVIAAVLNQYIRPEQRYDRYFAALANAAQTDLRIDNFNAFRRTLTHLSDSNTDGSLAQPVILAGKMDNGVFIPDIKTIKKDTNLYP